MFIRVAYFLSLASSLSSSLSISLSPPVSLPLPLPLPPPFQPCIDPRTRNSCRMKTSDTNTLCNLFHDSLHLCDLARRETTQVHQKLQRAEVPLQKHRMSQEVSSCSTTLNLYITTKETSPKTLHLKGYVLPLLNAVPSERQTLTGPCKNA